MTEQAVTDTGWGQLAPTDRRNADEMLCGRCQSPIPPDVPVWMVNIGRPCAPQLCGVCLACREWWYGPGSGAVWPPPQPCITCGRPVGYRLGAPGHHARCYVACSWDCRSRAYTTLRLARREAARRRACVGCGEVFTPPRADGRYCSAACRQRAYRRRRATETRS